MLYREARALQYGRKASHHANMAPIDRAACEASGHAGKLAARRRARLMGVTLVGRGAIGRDLHLLQSRLRENGGSRLDGYSCECTPGRPLCPPSAIPPKHSSRIPCRAAEGRSSAHSWLRRRARQGARHHLTLPVWYREVSRPRHAKLRMQRSMCRA